MAIHLAATSLRPFCEVSAPLTSKYILPLDPFLTFHRAREDGAWMLPYGLCGGKDKQVRWGLQSPYPPPQQVRFGLGRDS